MSSLFRISNGRLVEKNKFIKVIEKNKPYSFKPLLHGYEHISNYPELGMEYPLECEYYVKIIDYHNYGDLVYWASILRILGYDDRIEIVSTTYDFRDSSIGNKVIDYFGIITNEKFAIELLKHIYSPCNHKDIKIGIERYSNNNIGEYMRNEYSQYYK